MTYLGFLAIVFFFLIISHKDHKKFEKEKYDAFRRGFLAAIEMDNNNVPRSYTGTENYPATDSHLRINEYWKSGRTVYFAWFCTPLYKLGYSEGYRMAQIDAERVDSSKNP